MFRTALKLNHPALESAVAEDIITLLDKYPDLTITQRAVLKSAAAYLVQDEMDRVGQEFDPRAFDQRLLMTIEEYELTPGRVELWEGIPVPKDWETPKTTCGSRQV